MFLTNVLLRFALINSLLELLAFVEQPTHSVKKNISKGKFSSFANTTVFFLEAAFVSDHCLSLATLSRMIVWSSSRWYTVGQDSVHLAIIRVPSCVSSSFTIASPLTGWPYLYMDHLGMYVCILSFG